MKCKLCGDVIHRLGITGDIRVFSNDKDEYVDVIICDDCLEDVNEYSKFWELK